MNKFVYKMQNILDIKYKLEDQAKTNYSTAQNKVDLEKQKLMHLVNRREEYENRARGYMTKTINILELKFCKDATGKMQDLIKKQSLQVMVAERNLEQARIQLYEVMNDRKTHEKLKENAKDDFAKEMNRKESKEIDELVCYTYGNFK